jgi:Sushi repeat (SCR repeat)
MSFRKTRYACDTGFEIHGNEQIFCRNGKWSSMPTCEIMPSTTETDGAATAKNQSSGLVKAVKNGGSVPQIISPSVISGIVFVWFIILMQ